MSGPTTSWWKIWKKAPKVGDIEKEFSKKWYAENEAANEFPFEVSKSDRETGKVFIPVNEKGWPNVPLKYMVPVQGNFVAFPLSVDSSEKRVILWYEESEVQRYDYYRLRCWYGDISDGMTIFGETTIFVAAEYIEERFNGGFLQERHLATINKEVADKWVIMEIDDRFQYGQNAAKNPKYRWLVYHPPAGGLPGRKMFQHRFGMNDIIDTANAIISAASKSKDIRVAAPSAIVDVLKKWVEKGTGDELRTFKKKAQEDAPLLYRQELKYQAILRSKPEQTVHSSSSPQNSHLKQLGNQTKSVGSPSGPN